MAIGPRTSRVPLRLVFDIVAGIRPLADNFEVQFPRMAALTLRALGRAPGIVRRRVLANTLGRADRAFNRGDMDELVALLSIDVEYVPPSPLYDGPSIMGGEAVREFWTEVTARFKENRITNVAIEETAPSRFVRTADFFHRDDQGELHYRIRQTTELQKGWVIRQVNELLDR
jgi:ketosteroid isomerase-like protein